MAVASRFASQQRRSLAPEPHCFRHREFHPDKQEDSFGYSQ